MRRALALLLATSLAAGALALGASTSATAAAGDPTIDGDPNVFTSANSITVSGTDPNNIGGTVDIQLNMASQGTPTVQPDGTWSGQIDLTGLPDDRYQVTVIAGNTPLYKSVWVHRDTTSLQITSPLPGATITSSADGCISVTATLNAPGATLNPHEMAGFLSVDGIRSVATAYVDGTAVTTCVSIKDVPNGAGSIWVQLISDGRSYLARVPITLALVSQVSVSAFAGPDGVVVTGSVTEPGPDTVLTTSLDGGAPEPVELRQAGAFTDVTTPWTFTHYDEAWVINSVFGMPYKDREVADGPHTVTLNVTSRGVTNQHGPYDVVVDGTGKLTIDTADSTTNPGTIGFSGTIDSIDAGEYPTYNLRYDAWIDGVYYGSNNSPKYTWHAPAHFGENRWAFTVGLPVSGPTGPVMFQVSALDRALNPVCNAVTVDGATTTPTPCKPLPPGIPTGLKVVATSPTTATLTFTAPTKTGGAPITGYTATAGSIAVNPFPTFDSVGAKTSISLTGLTTGRDVFVDVKARNSAGSSYASRPVALYSSDIFCNVKPKSTIKLNSSISVTCGYDNGLRLLYFQPDPVKVSLQLRKPGSTVWTTVGTKTVPLADYFTFTTPLKGVTGTWGIRLTSPAFTAPARYPAGVVRPAISPTLKTLVTGPAPTLSLAVSSNRITLGKTVTFTGRSTPTYAGQKVFLVRYFQGGWSPITSKTVSSTGAYSFSYKPTSRLDLKYAVWTPAAVGRPAGQSPSLLVTVL